MAYQYHKNLDYLISGQTFLCTSLHLPHETHLGTRDIVPLTSESSISTIDLF